MRSSQLSQCPKPPKFHQLKQLDYFKTLLKKIPDPHLKQLLPLHTTKLHTRDLPHHHEYIYIPDRTLQEECTAGVPIDPSVEVLSKKVGVFRVERKVDVIWRQVLGVGIGGMEALRIGDKFDVLYESILEEYAFNRTVYRKGQQFTGIFYILSGELKLLSQRTGKPLKTLPKHSYIGLQQLQTESPHYTNTILSNCNGTVLLFISVESMGKVREGSEVVLREVFEGWREYAETVNINIKDGQSVFKLSERDLEGKKIVKPPLKLNVFVKKCDQFMKNINRCDTGFNQYLKSKKIMLQLRQSMTAAKTATSTRTHNPTHKQNHNYTHNYTHNQNHKQNTLTNLSSLLPGPNKVKIRINTGVMQSRSQIFQKEIMKRLEFSKSISDNFEEMGVMSGAIHAGEQDFVIR